MEETTLQSNVLDREPKRSKFIVFFIISIIIIVVAFGGWRFLSSRTEESSSPATAPTPTEYQLPTEVPLSPSPEATPTAKPTALPTSKPTSKPTLTTTPKPSISPVSQSSTLDRSKLTVEVQNGSGVVGAAKKAADTLEALGYVINSIGNADNYDYTNVTMRVKSSKSNYLSLLQKDLASSYTIGTASADLTATSSADALVIVGK